MIQGELFDQEEKKWCYKCDRYLDPDQFYSDSTKKDNKDNKCKECTIARENSVKFKFRRIKQGASKRGYDFTLELQDTSGMLLDSCYYCGKEAQGEKVKLHGLDRVENNRGYHKDNVVTCCFECNVAKHKQTQEEFTDMCKRVTEKHMKNRTTQDDMREREQIEMFGLNSLQGRSNKYIPDATLEVQGKEYEIELKTGDVERKTVSTSRNVTLKTLDRYSKLWWIFSEYQKETSGFSFTGEHYILHGSQLQDWIDKQKVKLMTGTKAYAGINDWKLCKEILQDKVDEDVLERIDKCFRNNGLNDPKISWKYIETHGIKLHGQDMKQQIVDVISNHNTYEKSNVECRKVYLKDSGVGEIKQEDFRFPIW